MSDVVCVYMRGSGEAVSNVANIGTYRVKGWSLPLALCTTSGPQFKSAANVIMH